MEKMYFHLISLLIIYWLKFIQTQEPLSDISIDQDKLPSVGHNHDEPQFYDSNLYKINWLDQNDYNSNETIRGEEIFLTTSKQEKYRCTIPNIVEQEKNRIDKNSAKNDDLNAYKLLKPLFTNKMCSYRVENYWTYEICHGKYIRQYHEDSSLKGLTQEYYLGTFDMEDFPKYEKLYEEKMDQSIKLPLVNVEDFQLPYIEINMTDGTLCDLYNKKRFTRVLYVCIQDSKHEFYSIKETTTCEYEVIAFSSLLCLSPKFKFETQTENNINCYSMNNTVNKIPEGFELVNIEKEMKSNKSKFKRQNSIDSFLESKTVLIDTFTNGKEVHINFISETDNSGYSLLNSHSHIIKKFLKGEYCLNGGSGWWKYEFCYGKVVNQFHEEKNGKKTVINLGKWNLEEHKKWLDANPNKKPKQGKTPKQVWHYYQSGDYCETKDKSRTVEVKLKCRNEPSNPDSVAIYLMEPKTCDYILGVESPIICDLLSTVNEYGIFQFTNNE